METKIKVTGSVILTEELNAFIEGKMKKIGVFLKKDPSALAAIEVGTTGGGQRTGDVFRGEIHLTFSGGNLYAEAVADNLHKAIDRTVEEMRRELRKAKSRNRDMVRRGAATVKEFFRSFGK